MAATTTHAYTHGAAEEERQAAAICARAHGAAEEERRATTTIHARVIGASEEEREDIFTTIEEGIMRHVRPERKLRDYYPTN